mgnify:CR=1 FL=1
MPPRLRAFFRFLLSLVLGCAAALHAQEGCHQGQAVLDAVVDLAQQQFGALLGLTQFGGPLGHRLFEFVVVLLQLAVAGRQVREHAVEGPHQDWPARHGELKAAHQEAEAGTFKGLGGQHPARGLVDPLPVARDATVLVHDDHFHPATLTVARGGFDALLLLPFVGWLALYVMALAWFVLRLWVKPRSEAADPPAR